MLYIEIIAVCSQIHTKHINTLCGQNVGLLNVKLVVHIVTTELQRLCAVLDLGHSQTTAIFAPTAHPTDDTLNRELAERCLHAAESSWRG